MKTLIIYTFLIFVSYTSCGQEQCEKTKVPAFTVENHPKVLEIFDKPNGKINQTLSLEGEEGVYFTIINESMNNWLRISIEDLNLTEVWVKTGSVGVSTRNYNGEDINLYQDSNIKSKRISYLKGEQIVIIMKVCNDWAFIEGIGENNQIVHGWLQPDMQCGDTVSTCP